MDMRAAETTTWFPLSVTQRSRCFVYELEPGNRGNHNNVFAARLQGAVDPAAFETALRGLIARHPMLRAEVSIGQGQRILAEMPFSLGVVDAAGMTESALIERVQADAWAPFSGNESDGPRPLLRACLYVTGPAEAVFLLALDHLICDGWSYWHLLEELGEALAGAPTPAEPAAGSTYRDYVAWQDEFLRGSRGERQLDHWKKTLAGEADHLQLPLDRRRPAQSTNRQGFVTRRLGKALKERLQSGRSDEGATLYNSLLVALQILLHRYTGQDRIVIGAAVPGRSLAAWKSVVGDFANVVAVRADFDARPTARTMLRNCQRAVLSALRNQDYPFPRLVEDLGIAYGDENPIYQASFVFQKPRQAAMLAHLWNEPGSGQEAPVWGGLTVQPFPMEQRVGQDNRIALTLHAIEIGDDVRCDLAYDQDVLDAATVERMADHFMALLGGIAGDAERTAQQLPMLSDAERRQLVDGFNAHHVAYPQDALIHERFEAQAAARPDAVAVVFEDQSLTYGELDARANGVARALAALGVQPDDRVAICVERGLEMIVGLLGILKAGGAYVPLDPAYPADRLRYILEDSAPVALLAQGGLHGLETQVPVVDLSTVPASAERPLVAMSPSNLAYIIYTSGSTGTPKGVMVEHRNVARLFTATDAWFGFDESDVWTMFHSYAFDFSVWEIWGALLYGGRLVVVPQDVTRSPDEFYELVCSTGTTILNQTPSAFRQFISAQRDSASQHRLREVVFGGEALEVATLEPWFERNGDQQPRLVNMYGITETTVHVTYRPLDRSDVTRGGSPIGVPIPDLTVYVLDGHREPVPIGVVGELYVGGAGVARGYLNRAELTSERFIVNPFGEGTLYKSGDLGRRLPDGSIDFIGRNDAQVKIRGFRIELGEIEAKLGASAGVREAVVIAREDVAGDKRLVAYLVAESGAELEAASLRAALLAQLPEYMVPSAFVELDALPLTTNGKLDRKALPVPEATALAAREYEAPQGEVEETLAGIWRELLRVEQVGRHDRFFELGGHSLLAMQLISHLRTAFRVELPLRQVFASPTLSGMAEVVRAAGTSTLGQVQRADRSQPLPLSLAQQRLWFLDQLDHAASASYSMPAALRLVGKLDAAALQATLDRLVARHEVLRTRFVAVDGVPYQQIAPEDCGFALVHEDLSGLPPEEREAAVAARTVEEARIPFDLGTGPMIRGRLLQLTENEHVLLVTQHHIVTDGWSIDVMVREVGALYTAFREGSADPLPPLELQYADYAQWQREWLRGEELARQTGFWKEHLTGAPALLALPADRARPAVQSHAGAAVPVALSPELTAALRAFSQRHGVTLYMTLLSAWGVLLSRLSGQQDVVIGTPVANRQRQELESLIGFFVNMLAVRLRTDGNPTFASLLAQVKETTLAAFAHQELPFEQVVEAVQPQRSLSHSPLAQVTFTWNNVGTDGSALHLPGLTLVPLQHVHETIQFDLQMLLDDGGDTVGGVLVYARDLFDRETVERWTAHFVQLLEAIAADASTTVDALPLLADSERRQVLEVFNDTAAGYPSEALIQQLFEQQAAALPDAVAVVYEGESVTYGELNARANQLAHYLITLGVQPDDRVAICTERNVELIVGLLGILKAGGSYLPLDPGYPRERLAWMLEDAAPVALLIHSDVQELLPETEVPVLRLDVDVPVLTRRLSAENPVVGGLQSRNLAYVIYTSGSTGTPKGVMVDHRCVTRLVINNPYFQATGEDCFAHCANPAFDAATWEIWGALLNGARLLVVPPSVVMEPSRLNATLASNDVTALWLTVGLFNQYVDSLPDAFAKLRYLLVGGDALDPRTIRQLLAREQRPAHVVNGYGPTETTTFAITHDIRAVAGDARSIPLGKPIANTQIYILDANRQPVPVGVEGEIYIGGHGVARGYLNRAELTAERFLANPFAEGTMYKTGDRGRWLADGTIEFLGRNDFQVKLRGFRIELGEIEARLSECAGVRDAIVMAREDVPGDKRLVAYLAGDGELSVADLRDALARQLPEYMVPSAFVQLDAFPLTANGKVDRKALPAPEATALSVREYEAPQGEIEEALATLWQELLHVERVGRHDDFFELGGHSLLAVQLISHVRAVLGIELPLRELFAGPTLSALADAVRVAGASAMGQIQRADRNQPLPLSLAQQRLWFLDQLDGAASAAYHMPAALRMTGALDAGALQATLDALVARHESLRTSFVAIDGVPYQRIAPADRGFALVHEDLRSLPAEAREAAVESAAVAEAREPFDLSTGPLIRGRLLRTSDEEHVLLVTQHHIISDGWSIDVMVREVGALYAACLRGESDPLPALEVQYADYAQWQRSWLQGEELTRQVQFWKTHLSGAPELLELPLDRPRPAVQSYAGGTVPVVLSAELTAALREFSQRQGVTLYMTLLTAWAVLLSRLSGQQDIVIGTPVANRQRRELESLIGFFVNMLAVRLRLDDPGSTVAALLARVKETALAAFAHQELPFEQVVEAVQPQRSLSHSPLAQVTFTWNTLERVGTDGRTLELPGLTLEPVHREHETIQVDLQLLLDDAGDAIEGMLVYAADLFDRETIERWNGHFLHLLESMAGDPSAAVDTLPLLSGAERQQVLESFNDHCSSDPETALIHELFERQAAQRPDAVAVVGDDESLTYGELDARANQLAHYLIGLGVGPDDRVAICCERGVDLIVGFLGIVKAGGAYVPLDPSHPRERLAWVLEDSAPRVLLTHSDLEDLLPETELPVLRVDVDLPVLARRLPSHSPEVRGLSSANLAYVIYTSGSTGTPKGVMVEQRNVVQLVSARDYVSLAPESVVAQASNAAFDAATFEIWGALLNGGRLVLVGKETLIDPERLQKRLVAERVDTLFVTTALFNRVATGNPAAFATLGTLLFGGEKVNPEAVAAFLASGFQGRLLHVYGPTENTTFSTWYRVPNTGLDDGATVPIGRGLAGARVYLLDSRRQPVPIGVAGEIYIGGAGVARGYLARPELTEERFVADPFSPHADARMYKTGDLGRWLPGGNIEFLARNDFQVKIRGFRIELGEIEAKLAQCGGVREAIVLAREDADGAASDKRLVAYLVGEEGAELSASGLRETLSRQLPDYMVPSAFVQLDALPLTANGKVDRKALPAPEAASLSAREYEAPEGEIEETIAALWREQLNVERVGRQDNFFELGGHSLLAVQLISHIRAALGVELPLRDLFASPSLAALAEAVRAAGATEMGRIARADRGRPLPLSLAQQRLWFLAQFDAAASAAYSMPAAFRLRGDLDVAALQAALDRLVARQESLRARFVAIDGVPYQEFASPDCGFALLRADLSALPAEEREAAAGAMAAEEARAPFDLSAGPLIRGRLLALANDEHVLLITQHHIVSDGWSLAILVREVAALYTAFRGGEGDPLAPLAIQYADYAQWQREWLRGEELARQVDFWRGQLAGAPAVLELPLDRTRPAIQSHAGGSVPLALTPELTAGLRALSQAHGVTLFMTLLSAWGVLVSRLSGQQDVVIGTPVANRQRRDVEELIGFFVNTLALRLRLDARPTVAALLPQVKETALAAFAHQDLPFEQVVEAVQPQRSLSHSPLVQTVLALDNTADYGDELRLPGLSLVPVEQALTTAQYDLSVQLSESGESLSGFLAFATDLFDRETVERWAGHYVRLLEAMAAGAAAGVDELPLLSGAERLQLVDGFNAHHAAYPQDELIHERFEAQAAVRPDAVAVVFEEQSLTYGELDARANGVARALAALGVQPDDRVAICVERGLEMIVGLLGILKAGGAYVPLDPAYPADRLRYILEDSAPVALLAQGGLHGLETQVPVVDLSTVPASAERPSVAMSPSNLAYIIYTSGSTGTPKGVMVEHRNVARLFTATDAWFGFDESDVWTMFHSYAFDFSVWEIWGALLYGGRLVVVPQDVTRSPDEFYELVCSTGTTILNQTPSAFRQFISAQRDSASQHRLREVVFGGEALEVATLEPWFERNGDQQPRLVNMYGITETTVHVTYRPLDRSDVTRGGSPIGVPIPDLTVYVLDGHREPVPIGVVGELYVGGAGVARGYLNRAELTSERFIANPFGEGTLYKSGDLGRRLPDGSIDFIGRNDAQVKIRGFRIELGEIEAKLGACVGVREAVVIAREDVAGDKRLVAYLVAESGAALEAASLRAMLLAQLPEYMVPSAFVELDALPLTTNGKLDRKALPVPEATALAAREYEAPQGEVEETLAGIWRELLRVEQVGRHDDFFELGGHSLLAVQSISRIRAVLGVDIALRELFAQSTLQALAEAVRRAAASTMERIGLADRSQPLPLSLAQQRLWFLDQLDRTASAAYHMPAALRLRGDLDLAALRAALDRLVARHESLRTSFGVTGGVPHQTIAPADCGFALDVRDLDPLASGPDEDFGQLLADEVSRPFDLSAGPLIRGQLFKLADDEHLLLIAQHHIVTDAWSIQVLVRELAALYAAFRRGEADPLPALEIQYADYAQWQRQWIEGDEQARQVAFWKSQLSGAPALLELPLDRPRPAVESHAGSSIPFALSPELTAALRAFSQRHGATMFMTLLSAWGLLLSRLSGQHDVVVGTPVANRQRREVEGLIGFFVNTLALRLRFDDDPSLASLIAQVKETTLAAFAHQELPFEQVVEAVQPLRSLSHSPLFQTLLALDNTAGGGDALRLPGVDLTPVQIESSAAQYELSLHLDDRGDALSGVMVYATDLFDRSTVERWGGHFVTLLEAMVSDGAASAATLPILSAVERRRVLADFNATDAELPQDTLVHELFEQQAAASPDAVAVVFEEQRLTYGELNARANQLAHELIDLGVRPDDRVAICAERSLEMVIGLLGILKAGGAYVPLDPAYPMERLQYMFRDAEPKALLTQQALQEALPEGGVSTLVLDSDALRAKLAARPASNPDARALGLTVRNLAYVIYTSGSTGMPKGVLNEHHGVVNRLWWAQSEYKLRHDDGVLQKTPFSFDVSVWEFFLPLLAGARLVMARPGGHQDPAYLADVIARERITMLHFVPSMLPAFLTQANADNGRSLRRILCSGEALPHGAIVDVLAAIPHVEVHNLYGPTEAAVDVTAWPCTPGRYGQIVPIGRPIANTRIYILDAHRQPVPLGVAGELYIGGVQVARGYLNRPELTAERFVRDPFNAAAFNAGQSARMYKTGDLARWLPDGNIEYLGRNDFQVKIRGFRIELGEIEAKLARCAGVREAVVTAREDVAGDKRLVAYLVAEDGVTLHAAELRAALSLQLPEYMVPAAFVVLEALPLTPNGKLDRKALPAPELTALVARAYEAPEGEIEEELARIWQELLRVERVGRHDSFFELGGHSLLAVQLQTRITEALLVDVPLRTLIVTGDLRHLAGEVAALQFAKFIGDDMDQELSALSAEELRALLESEEIE